MLSHAEPLEPEPVIPRSSADIDGMPMTVTMLHAAARVTIAPDEGLMLIDHSQ